MRDEYEKGRCQNSYDPTKLFPGSFRRGGEAYIETMADLDWAGNNLTQAQVGGFVYRFDNLGNGQVMYSMYNQASMHSFFLHLPGVPHKSRGGNFPFMGNIDQYFRRVEPNPSGCP
jgi:hypothetical protein